MSELIAYERRNSTAYLTLQRAAKQNALTGAMVEEILERLAFAGADDDVKSVVIQGEGPAFCAGFDIADPSDFQGRSAETLRSRLRSIEDKSDWMRRFLLSAKPLIVSVLKTPFSGYLRNASDRLAPPGPTPSSLGRLGSSAPTKS
jgi:enoyl-CoA hydratase/carnithine racemase